MYIYLLPNDLIQKSRPNNKFKLVIRLLNVKLIINLLKIQKKLLYTIIYYFK